MDGTTLRMPGSFFSVPVPFGSGPDTRIMPRAHGRLPQSSVIAEITRKNGNIGMGIPADLTHRKVIKALEYEGVVVRLMDCPSNDDEEGWRQVNDGSVRRSSHVPYRVEFETAPVRHNEGGFFTVPCDAKTVVCADRCATLLETMVYFHYVLTHHKYVPESLSTSMQHVLCWGTRSVLPRRIFYCSFWKASDGKIRLDVTLGRVGDVLENVSELRVASAS